MDSLLFAWSMTINSTPATYVAGVLLLCYKPYCVSIMHQRQGSVWL